MAFMRANRPRGEQHGGFVISAMMQPASMVFLTSFITHGIEPRYATMGGGLVRDHLHETGRFSKEINDKAWKLLATQMTEAQYRVFMEGKTVELRNKEKTHRLFIERSGEFRLMEGEEGEGYEVISGKIWESTYPMGDELSTFIDWFMLKTDDLIVNWNCGNFSIGNARHGMRR